MNKIDIKRDKEIIENNITFKPKQSELDESNKKIFVKKCSNSAYSQGSELDKNIIILNNKDLDNHINKLINNDWFILILEKEGFGNNSWIESIYFNLLIKYVNKIKFFYCEIPKNDTFMKNFILKLPLLSLMKNYSEKVEFEIHNNLYKYNRIEKFIKFVINNTKSSKKSDSKNNNIYTFSFEKNNKVNNNQNSNLLIKNLLNDLNNITSKLNNINLSEKINNIWLNSTNIEKFYLLLFLNDIMLKNYNSPKIEFYLDKLFDTKIDENILIELILDNYLEKCIDSSSIKIFKDEYKHKNHEATKAINNFLNEYNQDKFITKINEIVKIIKLESISYTNSSNSSNIPNELIIKKNSEKSKENSPFGNLKIPTNEKIKNPSRFSNLKKTNQNTLFENHNQNNLKTPNSSNRYIDDEQNFNNRKYTFMNMKNNNNIQNDFEINEENSQNHIKEKTYNSISYKSNKNIFNCKDDGNNINELKYDNIITDKNLKTVTENKNELMEVNITDKSSEHNKGIEEIKNNVEDDIFEKNFASNKNRLSPKKSLMRTASAFNCNDDDQNKSIISNISHVKKKYENLKLYIKLKQNILNPGIDNSIMMDSSIKNTINHSNRTIISKFSISNFFKVKTNQYNVLTKIIDDIIIYNKKINLSTNNKNNLLHYVNMDIINANDLILEYNDLNYNELSKNTKNKQILYFFMNKNIDLNLKFLNEYNFFKEYKTKINKYRIIFTFLYEEIKIITEKNYCFLYEELLKDNLIIISFFEVLFRTSDFDDFLENLLLFEFNTKNAKVDLNNNFAIIKDISLNISNILKIYLEDFNFNILQEFISYNNTWFIYLFTLFIQDKISINEFLCKLRKKISKTIFKYYKMIENKTLDCDFDNEFIDEENIRFVNLIKINCDLKLYKYIMKNLNNCNPYILGLIEFYNYSNDDESVLDFINFFKDYKIYDYNNFKVDYIDDKCKYKDYWNKNFNYKGPLSLDIKIIIWEILEDNTNEKMKNILKLRLEKILENLC